MIKFQTIKHLIDQNVFCSLFHNVETFRAIQASIFQRGFRKNILKGLLNIRKLVGR